MEERENDGSHGNLWAWVLEAVLMSRGVIRHLLCRTALAAGVWTPRVPAVATSGALGLLTASQGPVQLVSFWAGDIQNDKTPGRKRREKAS